MEVLSTMLFFWVLFSGFLLLGGTGSRVSYTVPFYSTPIYLPVNYQLVNSESSFLLKEATQDFMRNSSFLSRTEPFFIHQARKPPSVRASFGSLSAEQPVPPELLQPRGSFITSSTLFTYNWKVQAFILREKIHLDRPRIQVLFYISGRDWDDYSVVDKLPCVRMFAFHETQEVRGSCRLQGELGVCVAELEPPSSWFAPPTVIPGRQKVSDPPEGNQVALYYSLRAAQNGQCPGKDAGFRNPGQPGSQEDSFGSTTSTPMKRIGNVRLFKTSAIPELSEHRVDGNFAVLVPSAPVRPRESVSAYVAASPYSPVEMFTLRVKLKDGVTFLGARPCNPMLWMISQDARVEGHQVVTLHCRKKESSSAQRVEPGWQRVVQVDLEMEVVGSVGTGLISWTVEYPGIRATADETETKIHIVPKELSGIVPLAMDTEILNTAVLNGRTVAVPVKVVTVEVDAAITDVSDTVQCRSTDENVVKVSDRCDYVYVNGKEMKGRERMLVNFTHSFITAQLDMNVWIPRLPLHIDVSDTEISPIRGWRIPTAGTTPRSVRDSDDEDDDDRRGRSCTLQYQRAIVRILTHFVAESAEGQSQLTYMLGSDWQMDVTGLVWDFLKVEDPRIARLQDGHLLEGVSTGMTSIQVLSPLSDSILAEKSVSVVDERISITELGLQLVSGLALHLQLSTGSNQAISATATTQEVLSTPKQEALVSAWLQFSDGSVAPLDLYDADDFALTVISLDEEVVRVNQDATGHWPVVSAQAEGQGPLLRVEMTVHESCQKTKPRRSVLAAGNCHVRVKYGHSESVSQPEYRDDNENHRQNLNLPDRTGMEGHYFYSSVSNLDEDGAMRRSTTTTKTEIVRRPGREKLSKDGSQIANLPIDFSDFPVQVDLPRGHSVYDEDLTQSNRGLSDLEIGMYALLGVFCLAILVFLINCISYTLKYRHKEMSIEGQESLNHAHDWVWLGNEAELLESHVSLSPQADEQIAMMDSSMGGLEEGSLLLNGGSLQKHGHERQEHRGADNNCGKDGKGDSPTTKRKRVKFTTFTTIPAAQTLGEEPDEEIKWVCQDVDMGESKELQNYMERLNDSVLKDVA